MFDIQATMKWVTAVATDPTAAAAAYFETAANWQQSFIQITLPLYVMALVAGGLITLVTGGSAFSGGFSLGFLLFSIFWAMAWTFVIAFIFDYVGGMFEAERNFDRAYALVALAIIPAAFGNAAASIPWLGWLLSLALSIYSLMLAYRFVPVFIKIAQESRVKHFAISIVLALIVNIVVSMALGSMLAPAVLQDFELPQNNGTRTSNESSAPTGIFGGVERQAELADAAGQDTYNPPSDGKLTNGQVESFADALVKTKQLRERLGKKFERLDESKEDEPSITDIFSGVGDAVRMSTAEMEVVKSAGGNWAEHQWVRSQIEVARIQQDLNEATEHNYNLFLKYQNEIEENE